MIDFLRKENKYLDNVSMSEELGEDLLLVDILPIKRDTSNEQEVKYLRLKRIVDDQLLGLNQKQCKIIGMYLNRRSYQEIADCVGIAKQNVGVCIKSFREKLAQKLGLDIGRWKHG